MTGKSLKELMLLMLVLVSILNCKQPKAVIQEAIIGQWVSGTMLVEYTKDGLYNMTMNGEKIRLYNTGQLTYTLSCTTKKDSCFTIIYSTKGDCEEQWRARVIIEKNLLYVISYKGLEGIKHHIDELGVYQKVEEGVVNTHQDEKITESYIPPYISGKLPITKYYIPSDFRGRFYVAYNEKKGIRIPSDELGNRVIKIPSTGLFKASDKERSIQYLKNRFEFYQLNKRDAPTRLFNSYDLYLMRKDSSLAANYDLNDLIVLPLGYNQIGRPTLNERLKENLTGNVEFFEVNTLKELLQAK